MTFYTLLLIAVALSMDAFAVSVSNGLCYSRLSRVQILLIAFTFGAFQALMPLIGYYLGISISGIISSFDHWIALILLSAVGIHMIAEAIKAMRDKSGEECKIKVCTFRSLITQGIATSIDALAVGISFAVVETNIFIAVLVIGVVTFILSSIGVMLGKRIGMKFGERAEIVGGLVLIGIGVKIFVEHIFLT